MTEDNALPPAGLTRKRRSGLTKKTLEILAKGFGDALKPIFQSYKTKIATLEQRIADLEARPGLKYIGVWKSGAMYAVGDAVTFSGSLWICKTLHVAGATIDHPCWTLAVKRK